MKISLPAPRVSFILPLNLILTLKTVYILRRLLQFLRTEIIEILVFKNRSLLFRLIRTEITLYVYEFEHHLITFQTSSSHNQKEATIQIRFSLI
jgi:hypothetical protein